LGLRIGDVVTLGTDLPDAYDLPDFRGGSILGLSARVVARRPRYDQARVDVRLELLDRLLHVCPAATITAYDGLKTYTLSTTAPEVSGASPANDFWIGAVVTFVDRSSLATTPATHATSITAIPTTTQITIDVNPSFAAELTVDYVVLNPETSSTGTSASGYSLIELAKLADSDGNAGSNASTDNEPRWR
jgi:hypothetical protein